MGKYKFIIMGKYKFIITNKNQIFGIQGEGHPKPCFSF